MAQPSVHFKTKMTPVHPDHSDFKAGQGGNLLACASNITDSFCMKSVCVAQPPIARVSIANSHDLIVSLEI